jgi:hypothetical protein
MKNTLAALLISTTLLYGCATHDRPPTIAGQTVPNQNVVLDFTKRYDVICRDAQQTKTYRNRRILGYTGELVRDASGSETKSYFPQFGRWLALELSDGRRVFLPPGNITFLEETMMK